MTSTESAAALTQVLVTLNDVKNTSESDEFKAAAEAAYAVLKERMIDIINTVIE